MTTFPSQIKPLEDLDKPLRRAGYENIIKASRATTPAKALEQRAQPRLSIGEMNELDMDEIRRRFERQRIDQRGPVTRFLDLLDLPRNAIVSTVFPSIERRKRLAGDTAAAGLGQVRASDILEELGVENRIIRGVVGLGLDIATDPLTYVGPAGWGLKAGKAVVTKGGKQVLRQALEDVTRGVAVRDPAIAKAFAAKGFTPEAITKRIAAGDNIKNIRSEIGNFAFGGKAETPLDKIGRVFGGERKTSGGWLGDNLFRTADLATDPTDAALVETAKDFMSRYGRQATPGLRIGKSRTTGKLAIERGAAGVTPEVFSESQIAHVPFTDIALSVPGFTAGAKLSRATGLAALAGKGLVGPPKLDITTAEMASTVAQMDDLLTEREALARGLSDTDESLRSASAEGLKSNAGQVNELSNWVQEVFNSAKSNPNLTTDELLYQAGLADQAAAKFNLLRTADQRDAGLKSESINRLWSSLNAEAKAAAEADPVSGYATYRSNLDAEKAKILDMSEEAVNAAAQDAALIHERVKAAQRFATAAKAPIVAALDNKDTAVRDLAEVLLGLDPGSIPLSAMTAMGDAIDPAVRDGGAKLALRSMMAQGAKTAREVFGIKGGRIGDLARDGSRLAGRGMGPQSEIIANDMVRRVHGIADKAGVKPDQWYAVRRLVTAMTHPENPIVAGGPDAAAIAYAKRVGLLENKDLLEQLKPIAAELRQIMDDVYRRDKAAGLVASRVENYMLGNQLTKEARSIAGSQRRNFESVVSNAGPDQKLVEAFQRPRSTMVHQWTSPTGETRRFIEGQRVYTQFTPEELRDFSDAGRGQAEAIRAIIAEFDKMDEAAKAKAGYEPYMMTPMEVNDRVKDGEYAFLTGGALTRPDDPLFFEEDFALALANRLSQSERSHYNKYLAEIADGYRLDIVDRQIATMNKARNGAEFELAGGIKGKVENVKGKTYLWIGNRRYRRPETPVGTLYDPFDYGIDARTMNAYYPEEIAELVESRTKIFENETFERYLSVLDNITKYWKATTLLHPSWMVMNAVGNLALVAGMGLNPVKYAQFLKPAMKIAYEKSAEKLGEMKLTLGGREMTGLDIAAGPGQSVIGTSGSFAEAIQHLVQNGMLTPSQTSLMRSPKRAFSEINAGAKRAMNMAATEGAFAATKAGKAKNYFGTAADDLILNRVWGPYAKFNARSESWLRTAAYLTLLDDGYDAASAARKVAEGMMDFSTLTHIESAYLRRLMPFYSWIRNSAALGFRQLLENPKFFTIAPHAKDAIETAVNGEESLPRHLRPRYMQEQLAILVGQDPDRFAFSLGTALPQESATRFLAGFASPVIGQAGLEDLIAYLGNSVTPALKMPLEITAGREFYTGRTISSRPDEGDKTLVEYGLGQIRPFRELGIGDVRRSPLEQAFGRSVGEGLARSVIGGRVQPLSEERRQFQIQREYDDQVRNIRRRIGLAEREGDKEASARARTRLLGVYQKMLEAGVERGVPLWARKQIQELTSQ